MPVVDDTTNPIYFNNCEVSDFAFTKRILANPKITKRFTIIQVIVKVCT